MSKSIIQEIFYGNRGQQDSIHYTKEYFKLLEETVNDEKAICDKLSPELLNMYKKTSDTLGRVHSEEVRTNYTEGFKIGLLIGLEISEN